MKLNDNSLQQRDIWEEKEYILPNFDRNVMMEETKKHPVWVHFGAGNIFRAFLANGAQTMLEKGAMKQGVIVAEGFDYEIVEKMYRPCDNNSILVTLKADGNIEKTVVRSIAESCILDSENEKEFKRLQEIFSAKDLQLATFTITEKGYSLVGGDGKTLKAVEEDFTNGPEKPGSYMGKVAALLYTRYRAGKYPMAMVSTDNCSHNGDKLSAAILAFAKAWADNGLVDTGFVSYVEDKEQVSFPWTMIDKITPRPDASVEEILRGDGLEDLDPVVTSKNTYVAPFVNAEETEYLVVEDSFPNGRPELEKAGFLFTERETVDKVERMKVCTCLNPLHTALAVYGCVLGYTKISEEMKDPQLKAMVERLGYVEGLPVVVDPGIIAPKDFLDTVLKVRIPNPFMPDTPQRIATDTSQKLPIRYGETIKNYVATGRDLGELKIIPLVFAGWLRYLMGVDDEGKTFEPSSDPRLASAQEYVKNISLGDTVTDAQIHGLLEDKTIFGVDLYEVGLAQRVLDYFNELVRGIGSVRETLCKYC